MSAVNEQHPNDADVNDFFGEEGAGNLTVDPAGAEPPVQTEVETHEPTLDVDPGEEAEGVELPADGVERSVDVGSPTVAEPTPAEVRSGTAEREYVILQELTLDGATLDAMLVNVKQGQDPLTALFEVERLQARNHKHAFEKTWKNNEYAPPVRLAAVTERSFDIKTIKPRVITTSALEIN